jgi:hypothetical protein
MPAVLFSVLRSYLSLALEEPDRLETLKGSISENACRFSSISFFLIIFFVLPVFLFVLFLYWFTCYSQNSVYPTLSF